MIQGTFAEYLAQRVPGIEINPSSDYKRAMDNTVTAAAQSLSATLIEFNLQYVEDCVRHPGPPAVEDFDITNLPSSLTEIALEQLADKFFSQKGFRKTTSSGSVAGFLTCYENGESVVGFNMTILGNNSRAFVTIGMG